MALPQSQRICGSMKGILVRLVIVCALAGAAIYSLPEGWRMTELAIASRDPAALADLRLRGFDRDMAVTEIEAALKADDAELANSFAALAADRKIELPKELAAKVEAANSLAASTKRNLSSFVSGFLYGEPKDGAGFAGATTGDFMIYGDVRDLVREGSRWVRGVESDPLIMGLAGAGLVATAGTYFSFGAAAPARVGSTLLKVARRTGKISGKLADNFVTLLKTGGKTKVAGALADIAKVQRKGGTRAALEGLKSADNVTDLARAGVLAEKKGSATLAIFKRLGRGAVAVGVGALAIAGWMIGAASSLFFFVVAVVSFIAAVLRWMWPGRWLKPATAPRRGWLGGFVRYLLEPFRVRPTPSAG